MVIQYQRLLDGMKNDMREHQRSAEQAEMRYLQARQELASKVSEAELARDYAIQAG